MYRKHAIFHSLEQEELSLKCAYKIKISGVHVNYRVISFITCINIKDFHEINTTQFYTKSKLRNIYLGTLIIFAFLPINIAFFAFRQEKNKSFLKGPFTLKRNPSESITLAGFSLQCKWLFTQSTINMICKPNSVTLMTAPLLWILCSIFDNYILFKWYVSCATQG